MIACIRKHRLTQVLILLACGMGIGVTLKTFSRGATDAQRKFDSAPISQKATMEERFDSVLRLSDEDDRKQAARAIFADLGLAEIPALAPRVEKFTADFAERESGDGWIISSEFYRRWGELAPSEALKYLKDHKSDWASLDQSVWTAWARTAPDAAVAAYDPKLEGQYSWEIQQAILDGLSSVDPAKALRFADAQEFGSESNFVPENRDEHYDRYAATSELLEYIPVERPDHPFGLALYSWVYRDPQSALEAMLALRHETFQRAALGYLFSNWLMFDPEAALLALGRIKDRGLRESTTHTAMQAYLLRHPQEAFEMVIRLPKYVTYRYKGNPTQEIDPFAEADPSVDNELIEIDEEEGEDTIPYRYYSTTITRDYGRMALISEAAASLGYAEGKAGWERAAAIEKKGKRLAAMGGALAGWLLKDREAVVRFITKGIADHSLEESGDSDFPGYAARLVAKSLAKHDFRQAIEWIEALPAGSLREAGIDTAAETRRDLAWHLALKEASPNGGVDPYVFQDVQKREYAPVLEWLASLPPSKARNESLRSLAREILTWKDNSGKGAFDFDSWTAMHPELAAELKQELARKKKEKGGTDEK